MSEITTENEQSWIDLVTLSEGYATEPSTDQIVFYFQNDSYTPTTRVLFQRIVKEIGHKIIKWEKKIDFQTLKGSDTLYTDITSETMDVAEELFNDNFEDYDYEETYINRPVHNNSSPSNLCNCEQQSDSSEDEPSPQPVL